jgi:branched-chain amino acid transport system permease protein
MVTLAVGVLAATAADQWRTVTGGTDGLYGIPAAQPWPTALPMVDGRHLYWYTLAATVLVLAAVAGVLRSPAGRLLRGCRDNETRMRADGHPVGGYLLATYTGTGAVAGIAGGLLVTVERFVSPADVGFHTAALVLLAVIIGGATSIVGAVSATGLVIVVRDWAATTVPGHGPLVLGALFIGAVFLLPPQGLSAVLPAVLPRLAGHVTAMLHTGREVAR